MTSFRPSFRSLVTRMAVLAAILSPPTWAQQQTGGAIFEVVTPAGEPLKGAEITLSGTKLASGSELRTTDERGRVSFVNVQAGHYLAEFQASGFLAFRQEIDITLGTASLLRIVMTPGEMAETMKVTAAQPIDPTEVGSKTSIGGETLQNIQLGSGNRSYQDAVQQVAGVGGGANPSVRGSTLGENVYLIDGVNTTD